MSSTTIVEKPNTSPDCPAIDYRRLFKPNPVVDELHQYLVPHRVFAECEREILKRVASPGGANIMSVVGPTGAGKTQLLNEVVGALTKAPDPGPIATVATPGLIRPYLPVIYVKALTGTTFQSRFRSLLIEILKQVNSVLTESGLVRLSKGQGPLRCESPRRVSIPTLEELTRVGLRERRVRAVLIDEGQHLAAKDATAEDWFMVADSLKVLGSVSGTLIALFGTFELLCLPDLSGQLGRRTKAIHMRRYLWDVPGDRAEFERVVRMLAQASPDALPEKLLIDNLPLIYTGCVGCIGTLFDWFHDAMVHADSGVVTLDNLLENAFPEKRLRRFDWEAQECERAFKREKGGLANFANELCGSNKAATVNPVQQTTAPAKKLRRGRVRRKASYDAYEPRIQEVA